MLWDIDGLRNLYDRLFVIDTETTGVRPGSDEVLSLAIVDGNGELCYSRLFKPAKHKRWPEAQKINGIRPMDVVDEPNIIECKDTIERILGSREIVVGYNLRFDLEMLAGDGISVNPKLAFDVMREFSAIHGTWDERLKANRYAKLTDCAAFYGYMFDAHSAVEDAKATAYCFRKLLEDDAFVAKQERLRIEMAERRAAMLAYEDEQRQKEAEERHAAVMRMVWIVLVCAVLGIVFYLACCHAWPL